MKKLLSVILTLVLLLAALPASALAVTEIASVYAYTAAPVGGMTVPYGNDDPEAPRVTTEGVHMSLYEWWGSDGLKMAYGEQFVTGKTYTLRVQVFANGGYAIADTAWGYINGHHGAELNHGADYLTFSLEFTAEAPKEITAFSVSVTPPAVGGHPTMDFSFTGAGLTVQGYPGTMWYHGTKGNISESHVYEAGGHYYVAVAVKPADPTEFFATDANGDPAVTVTCAQGEVQDVRWSYYDSDALQFTLDFGNLGEQIQTVQTLTFTGITPPAEGMKPSYDVGSSYSNFGRTLNMDQGFRNGVRWFDLTDGAPQGDDLFEGGHQYRLDLEVEPASGWVFDPAVTTATVNGKSASIEGLKTKAVVSYTFPALGENQVVSSIDLTVPAPKIGEKASYAVQIAGAGLHQAAISDSYTQNGVKWYRNSVDMMPGAVFGYEFVYEVDVTVELDSGFEFAKTGNQYAVAATVNGQSAEVEFSPNGKKATVYFFFPKIDRILDHIEIITPPDKTEYKAGESFETAGMEVLAVFKDHSNEFVGVTVTPEVLQESDTYVTVSYTEGSVTATETVPVKVLPAKTPASLAVTKAPAKTAYKAGEKFDPTGMELTVTYTDQTTALVKPVEISPKILSETDSAVTVSYTENGVTVKATVPITMANDKIIADVAVTVAAPKVGEKASLSANVPADAKYTVKSAQIFCDEENAALKAGDIYGKKTYILNVTLAPAAGCSFAPDSAIKGTVNGESAQVRNVDGGVLVTKYYMLGNVNPFTDIKESDYFYDAVIWAYYAEPQVTNGMTTTEFGPQSTVTRGQAVTFLWRAVGCPEPKTTINPFEDVKENEYYYKAVLWAVENGITKGTNEAQTQFSPKQTCSTAHILTFLYRALGIGTDGWYAVAEAWAKGAGLLDGLAITVAPDVDCPRCDVVLFIYRAVGK